MTTQSDNGRGNGHGARSVRAELRARARRSAIPMKAVLELTAACNLRCIHCYITGDDPLETSIDRWIELVGELADSGCFGVTLTGGEVCLKDGWLDVAAAVRRHRMSLTVYTSGTAFSDAELDRLIAIRPNRVSVTLYGDCADDHEAVTRVPGSFQRSVETLRRLRVAGITCRIGSVLMRETIDNYRKIAGLAERLGCDFIFDPNVAPRDDGSLDVLEHRVDADRLAEFYLSEIVAARTREGRLARGLEDPDPIVAGRCDAGLSTLFIDARGDVYPCMGFPPSFGNIREEAFSSVWNSPTAQEHRIAMHKPIEKCEGCELRYFCTTRCPRVAFIEDGDPCGPSSRACEIARVTVEIHDMMQNRATLSPTIVPER